MAVKIRCSDCRKKISVDEAFSGSMCRCPYCKSIVMVPVLVGLDGESSSIRSRRPDKPERSRPRVPKARAGVMGGTGLENVVGSHPIIDIEKTRPMRPVGPTRIDTPGVPQVPASLGLDTRRSETVAPSAWIPSSGIPGAGAEEGVVLEAVAVDTSKLTAEQLAAIPQANRVFLQGLVTLFLIGVLILMVVVSVYLGTRMMQDPAAKPKPEPESPYVEGTKIDDIRQADVINPFRPGAAGRTVCGDIPLTAPVIFCVDGGGRMLEVYEFAQKMVEASILSLQGDDTFAVIVANETGPKMLGGRLQIGGSAGLQAVGPLLEDAAQGGATNPITAVDAALKHSPKTIVLIVSKKDIDEAPALAARIKKAGAKLVILMLGYRPYQEESLKAVEKDATVRLYEVGALEGFYEEVIPPH